MNWGGGVDAIRIFFSFVFSSQMRNHILDSLIPVCLGFRCERSFYASIENNLIKHFMNTESTAPVDALAIKYQTLNLHK